MALFCYVFNATKTCIISSYEILDECAFLSAASSNVGHVLIRTVQQSAVEKTAVDGGWSNVC